jgi:D-glycero-D-manno-heptose 1,7-bisphosphate phosphatase
MVASSKIIFLDRDGVLNEDKTDYVWRVSDFYLLPQVVEALVLLKQAGYLLVIVTNQSGIAKGIYTPNDVLNCFTHLQQMCGNVIDAHYFAPHHPNHDTASLSRKPDSLMIERALARFGAVASNCWLVGDSERDILAAHKQGIKAIKVLTGKGETSPSIAQYSAKDLYHASTIILNS